MNRVVLTDEQWVTIGAFLTAHPRVYVGPPELCRRFLNAVLWVLRSGAQWRLLPAEWGHWNSVFKRFARWAERGVWTDLHQHVAHDPDLQEVFLDSTVVRAHACAAGAKKHPAGRSPGALPRRLQHQGPCADRCSGLPAGLRANGRVGGRHHAGRGVVARGTRGGRSRRQGL